MIIYQSSPQKILFEAILLQWNQWANKIEIVFHIVLWQMLYGGLESTAFMYVICQLRGSCWTLRQRAQFFPIWTSMLVINIFILF